MFADDQPLEIVSRKGEEREEKQGGGGGLEQGQGQGGGSEQGQDQKDGGGDRGTICLLQSVGRFFHLACTIIYYIVILVLSLIQFIQIGMMLNSR